MLGWNSWLEMGCEGRTEPVPSGLASVVVFLEVFLGGMVRFVVVVVVWVDGV